MVLGGRQGRLEGGTSLTFQLLARHQLAKESAVTCLPCPPSPGYQDISLVSSPWTLLVCLLELFHPGGMEGLGGIVAWRWELGAESGGLMGLMAGSQALRFQRNVWVGL